MIVLCIGPMPAGLSDGSIEDSAITASSSLDNASKPHTGRLNSSAGAWCPNVSDKQQYLQIDLGLLESAIQISHCIVHIFHTTETMTAWTSSAIW